MMTTTSDAADLLKTEFHALPLAEVLQKAPTVLLGVTEAAGGALAGIGVKTVFDLALSRVFQAAVQLNDAADNQSSAFTRFGAPATDMVWPDLLGGIRVNELRFQPVDILAGITVSHYDDGSTRTLAVYDLDLAPGQSAVFDEDRPPGSRVIAVEGLIRMVADGIGITDGYASAHASDDRGFVAAELGIRPRSAALSVGENVFNDAPDVVAYAEVPE